MNGCLCCHVNQCGSRLKRAAREYFGWGCVDSCLLFCLGWNDEPKHMNSCSRLDCSLIACPKDKLREAVRAEMKHAALNRTTTAWRLEIDLDQEEVGENDDDDDDTMDESNEYMQVDADMFDFNLRAEAEAEEDDDEGSSSESGASVDENSFNEKTNDPFDNDEDVDDGGSDGGSAESHASSGNHTIISIDVYSRSNSFHDDLHIIDDMENYAKYFDADFSYAQLDYV